MRKDCKGFGFIGLIVCPKCGGSEKLFLKSIIDHNNLHRWFACQECDQVYCQVSDINGNYIYTEYETDKTKMERQFASLMKE
jgi:hypothetical protein